jgi:hypothetical protein
MGRTSWKQSDETIFSYEKWRVGVSYQKKSTGKSSRVKDLEEEIQYHRDRNKREGIVPRYQEPRSVYMPNEPTPDAMIKVKRCIFYDQRTEKM